MEVVLLVFYWFDLSFVNTLRPARVRGWKKDRLLTKNHPARK